MTKLYLQDKHKQAIVTLDYDHSAPDIVVWTGAYFKLHSMRKLGDAVYRPATIFYAIEKDTCT